MLGGVSDYTNSGVLKSNALLSPRSAHSKYHLSNVDVVTFVNTSQRVVRFVKSALVLCNIGLNGLVRWKDYNVFASVFQSTAEALCFVKRLANSL